MNLHLVGLLSFLVWAAGGSALGWAGQAEAQAPQTVKGEVQLVSGDTLIIRTSEGQRFTFHVTDDTEIPANVRASQRAGGTWVVVEYRKAEGGELQAVRVTEEKEGPRGRETAGSEAAARAKRPAGAEARAVEAGEEYTVKGEVQVVSPKRILIRTAAGDRVSFLLTETTEVPANVRTSQVEGGTWVNIRYRATAEGDLEATRVVIVPES